MMASLSHLFGRTSECGLFFWILQVMISYWSNYYSTCGDVTTLYYMWRLMTFLCGDEMTLSQFMHTRCHIFYLYFWAIIIVLLHYYSIKPGEVSQMILVMACYLCIIFQISIVWCYQTEADLLNHMVTILSHQNKLHLWFSHEQLLYMSAKIIVFTTAYRYNGANTKCFTYFYFLFYFYHIIRLPAAYSVTIWLHHITEIF